MPFGRRKRERRQPPALVDQAFTVDLCFNIRGVLGKGLRFFEDCAVFRNQVMPREHQIRCRLAMPRIRVKIGGAKPRTLAIYEQPPIRVLAYSLIACGKVENDSGPFVCKRVGGRARHPKILADFDTHAKLPECCAAEQLPRAKGYRLPTNQYLALSLWRGRKLAQLIKFPIIGKMRFWHHAKDLSVI